MKKKDNMKIRKINHKRNINDNELKILVEIISKGA